MEKADDESIVKGIFKVLYKGPDGKPLVLTDYQAKIASEIVFKKHKRLVVTATTRAGKSFVIALSALVRANRNGHETIKIVAPTYKQAQIIMGYIYGHLSDHPTIINNTVLTANEVETLGKKLNQNEISFLNNSSIAVLSAEGTGARLMGMGATMCICDESELMDDEVFRTRILRMLGDDPNSQLIEIGNPLSSNHFYEHFMDPNFHKIRIGWQDCVKEGRISQGFIEEQRRLLSPIEFKRLYDAEFVLTEEDNMFSHEKILKAVNGPHSFTGKPEVWFGIDIARFGVDFNVVAVIDAYPDGKYDVKKLVKWRQTDTMSTVGRIVELTREHKPVIVKVDESGVGGGVLDRLKEIIPNVTPVNYGEAPRDPKRFLNTKAESFFNLRTILEEERIRLPSDNTLIQQLVKEKFVFTSEARLKIDDNQDKSPDETDAVVIGLCMRRAPMKTIFVDLTTKRK